MMGCAGNGSAAVTAAAAGCCPSCITQDAGGVTYGVCADLLEGGGDCGAHVLRVSPTTIGLGQLRHLQRMHPTISNVAPCLARVVHTVSENGMLSIPSFAGLHATSLSGSQVATASCKQHLCMFRMTTIAS